MGNSGGGAPGSGAQLEERYFLQKVKLGQGSFGAVWRAVDRKTDEIVAVKQLDKAAMPKRGVTRKDIEREVDMMRTCDHKNITKIFDSFEDDRSIYLALEYCDGGDFGDKVKERGMDLKESEAAEWMSQICSAIDALHRKSVCHRDIKPDNFMVAGVTLKLADFGLAVFLPRGKLLQDKCGTPAFMSPEQHQLPRSRGYGSSCDIWAAGISMYMLMFGGRHPFLNGRGQLEDNMLLQGTLDFREDGGTQGFFGGLLGGQAKMRFSDQAHRFCRKMVNPNPAQRISAEDALRDQWLANAVPRAASAQPRASERTTSDRSDASAGRNFAPPARRNDQDGQSYWPTAHPPQVKQAPGQGRRGSDPAANPAAAQVAEANRREQQKEERIRHLEKKVTQLGNALASAAPPPAAKAAGQRGGAPLRAGMRVRYFSPTYGWMNGTVQSFNEADGTYNLDVRQHAKPENISPSVEGGEPWPIGTAVSYESPSYGTMDGEVTGYNQEDGTYNLDVRQHAQTDKIRARLGDRSRSSTAGAQWDDPAARANDGMRTENTSADRAHSPSADADDGGYGGYFPMRKPSAPQGHGLPADAEVDGMPGRPSVWPDPAGLVTGGASGGTAGAQSGLRVQDGASCVVLETQGGNQPAYVRGIIQGYNQSDGTFNVLVDPKGAARRMQIRVENIRPPIGTEAWPPRTMVAYESQSLGTWIPALVMGFNDATNCYHLDCRNDAAPERVRPRV